MIYRRNGLIFQSFQIEGWGEFKIARILPIGEDRWGAYRSIYDTEWERLISSVSEEALELALLGFPRRLLDCGVREAKGCIKLLEIDPICSDIKTCPSAKSALCTLKAYGKKEFPDCFTKNGLSETQRNLLSAWLDGYSVVVSSDS